MMRQTRGRLSESARTGRDPPLTDLGLSPGADLLQKAMGEHQFCKRLLQAFALAKKKMCFSLKSLRKSFLTGDQILSKSSQTLEE